MIRERFTDEERIAFYNSIAHLDPKKDFVIYDKDADTLSYTDKIKSHEKISGKPGDEEITRALILLHLVLSYGHNPSTIEIENKFSIGGRRDEGARAVETDICIKNDKGEIEVLCEVKRIQDYLGTDDSSIKKQLFDPFENIVKYSKSKYLFHLSVDVPLNKEHFPIHCIGIDTSISKTYKEWTKQGRLPHFIDLIKSGEKPKAREFLSSFREMKKISAIKSKTLTTILGLIRLNVPGDDYGIIFGAELLKITRNLRISTRFCLPRFTMREKPT